MIKSETKFSPPGCHWMMPGVGQFKNADSFLMPFSEVDQGIANWIKISRFHSKKIHDLKNFNWKQLIVFLEDM